MPARRVKNTRDPTDPEAIKVGQINLARSKLATEELKMYATVNNMDIILIQEPHTQGARVPGFDVDVRMAHITTTTPWAAIAVISDKYSVTQLQHITTAQLAAVQVTGRELDITFISQYFQVNKENNSDMRRQVRELEAALQAAKGAGIVIGADANAKSTLWHSYRTDDRGKKVEEVINRQGLKIINKEQAIPTFQGPRGSSNIDITLTKGMAKAKIESWTVVWGATQSDHNLIQFTVRGTRMPAGPPPRLIRRYRMIPSKFGELRERIQGNIEQAPPIVLNNRSSVDQAVGILTDAHAKLAKAPQGQSGQNGESPPWWNHQLTALKQDCYRSRKRMQRSGDAAERATNAATYCKAK